MISELTWSTDDLCFSSLAPSLYSPLLSLSACPADDRQPAAYFPPPLLTIPPFEKTTEYILADRDGTLIPASGSGNTNRGDGPLLLAAHCASSDAEEKPEEEAGRGGDAERGGGEEGGGDGGSGGGGGRGEGEALVAPSNMIIHQGEMGSGMSPIPFLAPFQSSPAPLVPPIPLLPFDPILPLRGLERQFKCDKCPQAFHRNHDLKRHKRIHLQTDVKLRQNMADPVPILESIECFLPQDTSLDLVKLVSGIQLQDGGQLRFPFSFEPRSYILFLKQFEFPTDDRRHDSDSVDSPVSREIKSLDSLALIRIAIHEVESNNNPP
ncbi:uncharacterized protein VTP21DRAFT_10994 [Calcarisporiella thermophila]|uniref:uncharacterized protein n=1 Tax=Calcarisporiella thermophila TaxID=911321 RepID=UPI003744691C